MKKRICKRCSVCEQGEKEARDYTRNVIIGAVVIFGLVTWLVCVYGK